MAATKTPLPPSFPYYARLMLRNMDDHTRGVLALAAEFGELTPEEYIWRELTRMAAEAGERLAEELGADVYARMVRVSSALRRPVPSRERAANAINAAKEKYLQAMWDTANPMEALIVAEISASTPYIWARTDPDFTVRWNEARAFCGMRPYKSRITNGL